MILEHTVVHYPGQRKPALAGISIAFAPGAFVALLGSSGAGKSTLLRTLNGLVLPGSGQVRGADGLAIRRSAAAMRAHRKQTAMVFQQHQLIGRLSVLRNALVGRLGHRGTLASMAGFSRHDRLVTLACLDDVELPGRALDRVDSLSGGQQQRVGIARALAQEPAFLLADEPVASLDPATAVRVMALFDQLCRARGIGLLVSLHQPELAARFADRIIGLSAGRIVFDGAPSALDDAALNRIYGAAQPPVREKEAVP